MRNRTGHNYRLATLFTDDDELALAARVQVPVLITSANGARREWCARLIHVKTAGPDGPFITFPVDGCRVEDATLGQLVDQALGGTLFIRDIGILSEHAQQQLYSLLSERARRNLMSDTRSRPFNVRIIAGASPHLDGERASGTFSEPLFYRLNVIHLKLDD